MFKLAGNLFIRLISSSLSPHLKVDKDDFVRLYHTQSSYDHHVMV